MWGVFEAEEEEEEEVREDVRDLGLGGRLSSGIGMGSEDEEEGVRPAPPLKDDPRLRFV